MKLSLKCNKRGCRFYAPITEAETDTSPWAMVVKTKCPCGNVMQRSICPVCIGTGWSQQDPCRCDGGLIPYHPVQ